LRRRDDRLVLHDDGVQVDVVGEGDLDDAVHACGGKCPDRGTRIVPVQRDCVREGRVVHGGTVVFSVHGPDDRGPGPVGQLGRQGADAPEHPVGQHRLPGHGSVGKHRAVGSDAWCSEACADLVADGVGQLDGLLLGNQVSWAAVPKGR
jgi:hypothetical protein